MSSVLGTRVTGCTLLGLVLLHVVGDAGAQTNNLVLHYTFENIAGSQVFDESGRNNHGVMNGAEIVAATPWNRVLDVRGAAEQGETVHVLNSASLAAMQTSKQLTISVWLKPRSIPTEFPVVLCRGGGGYNPYAYGGYMLSLNANGDNDMTFTSGNGALSTLNANGKWINDNLGKWVHVAVTVNSLTGVGKFYWNGQRTNDEWYQEQYGHNLFNLNFAVTNDLYIGGPDPIYPAGTSAAWYDGSLDDLRIYDRVLSDAEMSNLHANAKFAFFPGVPTNAPSDLMLRFTFDGDSGGVVSDSSGNGNNGESLGGSWVPVKGANKAYAHTGSSSAGDVIRVHSSASLGSMETTRQLTLMMWLKARSVPNEFPYVICKGGGLKPGAYGGYALALNANGDNDMTFVSGNGALSTFHANGKWINNNTGTWVHVAVTIDSSTGIGKFYWNGQRTNDEWYQEEYGHTLFGLDFDISNDLYIGGPDPAYSPSGSSSWFDGEIDEVRIYRRALSDSDIQALFSAAQSNYLPDDDGDLDDDGLSDEWETQFFGDTTSADPDEDSDTDGLNNGQEFSLGTNPLSVDSDGDGYSDGLEVLRGSDPTDEGSAPLMTPGDFDGDAKTDLAVYHIPKGDWYVRSSVSGALWNGAKFGWGWSETVPLGADFDGDGLSDPTVFHPAEGMWHIRGSAKGNRKTQWGWSETVPVPADYDGDGKVDLAVVWPGEPDAVWYILKSSDGKSETTPFGWDKAIPVPADYDGDGRADLAVFDGSSGQWYIKETSSVWRRDVAWGWAGVIPVPADYDGDAKADVAIYDPGSGDWHVRMSSTGQKLGGGPQNFGRPGKTYPVPADYDGDLKADLSVYAPAYRKWYVRKSTDGFLLTGDGISWAHPQATPVSPAYQVLKHYGMAQ